MSQANVDVFTPCAAYNRMAKQWELIDDLLGGTEAMRCAGTKWLPGQPKETKDAYNERLSLSYLYGALKDTIEKFVGLPFSRVVKLKGQLPEKLEAIEKNADLCGTSLTEFGRQSFRDALAHGLTHFLPSYPRVARQDEDGTIIMPNLYEETVADVRPYFQHIPAANVIGWRWKPGANGAKVLTQLRVREYQMEYEGDYGEKQVEVVHLYTPEYVQKFKRSEGKIEEGPKVPHTLKKIPLVTYYVRPTGFMEAEPPFMDLAWLNVEHWQKQSDMSWILHFTSFPIMHRTGASTEEMEKGVSEIGPNRMVTSKSPDAEITYVEHTGAAVGTAQKHLDSIEARMEVLGLSPAMERVANQTATSRGIDDGNSKMAIQGWVRTLEQSIEECYRVAAEMIGSQIDPDFSVDIKENFSLGEREAANKEILMKLSGLNKITDKRLLTELRTLGVFDETFDVDTELRELAEQGPPLAEMTLGSGFDPRQPPAQAA